METDNCLFKNQVVDYLADGANIFERRCNTMYRFFRDHPEWIGADDAKEWFVNKKFKANLMHPFLRATYGYLDSTKNPMRVLDVVEEDGQLLALISGLERARIQQDEKHRLVRFREAAPHEQVMKFMEGQSPVPCELFYGVDTLALFSSNYSRERVARVVLDLEAGYKAGNRTFRRHRGDTTYQTELAILSELSVQYQSHRRWTKFPIWKVPDPQQGWVALLSDRMSDLSAFGVKPDAVRFVLRAS